MKKILSIVLVLSLVFVLSACGKEKGVTSIPDTNTSTPTTQTETESIISNNISTNQTSSENKQINNLSSNGNNTTTSTPPTTKPATSSTPTISSDPTTSSIPTASSNPTTSSNTTTSSKPTPLEPIHAHSYSQKVTAATCTEKGYTTYTCSCGDTYKDNYTNPSHSYIKYVCSACNMVDKTHAYEFLVEWVKENGKTNGTIISYTYWQGASMYTLGYNAQYDSLSVNKTEKYNGVMFFSNLYLNDYFYGVSFDGSELTGFLSAEQFSASSPITYVEYTGDSSAKANFIELSRLSMGELVEWLNWFLNATEMQITISDLGFKSYKV